MKKISFKTIKKILIIIGAVGLFFIGTVFIWASTIQLPDMSTFEARKIANSSKITDRTGTVMLYDIHQSVRRTQIPFDQMGDNVKHAVISIEDAQFYTHGGIKITSIIRAMLSNVIHGSFSQGGSTLTQQVVKNTLLNSNKNVVRKLKEWVLAVRLERQMSKDQILTIYLNDAPYGGTIYGIEEASEAFFSKHSKDLDIAESAYLASIPNAPTYYSPFGKNRQALEDRKNLTLKKMLEQKYITQAQYDQAKKEKVVFNIAAANSIKAPHFVFYILDYLEQKYGADVMENGGYTIQTTLDYTMQQQAEQTIAQYADQNKTKYNASNSGLVAIDPKTGQILAMVGSKNYFDKTIDGAYNIATAKRQPGSSFKPFIYLSAFEKGYTPDTVLFDVPTEFSTNCTADEKPLPGHAQTECYNPDDFDNKFKGPINLRSALAESRNVPAVKLLYLVGLNTALQTAQSLGITTLTDPANYGLSLVLGGGEVTLLDMTSAYSVFANNGTRNEATGILSIKDSEGNTVENFTDKHTEVYDPNAIKTLNDVLSDPAPRVPTFGTGITIPGVAVKTGTTNDDHDAWIIGYTPDITVGVWSGNNDNSKMKSGGSAVSGPIWKTFMTSILPNTPHTTFEKPIPPDNYNSLKPVLRGSWLGNESVWIDKTSGQRATDATPTESRIEKIITSVHDILYWVNKDDPTGPAPTNPNSDPEFRLWEPAVQTWWENHKGNYQTTSYADIPKGYDTVHTGINTTAVTFQNLPNSFPTTSTQTIFLQTKDSPHPVTAADIYINDNYLTTLQSPFKFSFTPKEYGYSAGSYTIKALATDNLLNTLQATQAVTFTE
ncbi:MAG: PBP1A family penicillin-binding protein [bacterium]